MGVVLWPELKIDRTLAANQHKIDGSKGAPASIPLANCRPLEGAFIGVQHEKEREVRRTFRRTLYPPSDEVGKTKT